jgi:hypothetical protein
MNVEDFLYELLRNGRVRSRVVYEEAKRRGFSRVELKAARGVCCYQSGFGKDKGGWWELVELRGTRRKRLNSVRLNGVLVTETIEAALCRMTFEELMSFFSLKKPRTLLGWWSGAEGVSDKYLKKMHALCVRRRMKRLAERWASVEAFDEDPRC